MEAEIVVFVADAGSASKGNFHWVCSEHPDEASDKADELSARIVEHLNKGQKVALGYECPLFVPCPQSHDLLGKSRIGECTIETGNRPFSAGAGASVFATGIQSLAWVLNGVKQQRPITKATTSWTQFQGSDPDLFVWEAFVSGSEKAVPASHVGDARLAIDAFVSILRETAPRSAISDSEVFSVAGAAILHSGLSDDLGLLRTPCLVLRPLRNAQILEAIHEG